MQIERVEDVGVGALKRLLILIGVVVLVLGGGVSACMFGGPSYHVWEQHMAGEAEYARAAANRQIIVTQAQADAERVMIHANAEAHANATIGDSLTGERGERRLQYLTIDALRNHPGNTIYIPTEASLPITEASRDIRGRQP